MSGRVLIPAVLVFGLYAGSISVFGDKKPGGDEDPIKAYAAITDREIAERCRASQSSGGVRYQACVDSYVTMRESSKRFQRAVMEAAPKNGQGVCEGQTDPSECLRNLSELKRRAAESRLRVAEQLEREVKVVSEAERNLIKAPSGAVLKSSPSWKGAPGEQKLFPPMSPDVNKEQNLALQELGRFKKTAENLATDYKTNAAVLGLQSGTHNDQATNLGSLATGGASIRPDVSAPTPAAGTGSGWNAASLLTLSQAAMTGVQAFSGSASGSAPSPAPAFPARQEARRETIQAGGSKESKEEGVKSAVRLALEKARSPAAAGESPRAEENGFPAMGLEDSISLPSLGGSSPLGADLILPVAAEPESVWRESGRLLLSEPGSAGAGPGAEKAEGEAADRGLFAPGGKSSLPLSLFGKSVPEQTKDKLAPSDRAAIELAKKEADGYLQRLSEYNKSSGSSLRSLAGGGGSVAHESPHFSLDPATGEVVYASRAARAEDTDLFLRVKQAHFRSVKKGLLILSKRGASL